MIGARTIGFLFVLLVAACAGPQRAPAELPQRGAQGAAAVAAISPDPALPEPQARRARPPEPPRQPPAKAGSATTRAPAKVVVSPKSAEQGPKESVSPGPVKQQAAPPLDLKSLESRLRETKAIGLFTKVALKNQVDDLLEEFRDYYQGRSKRSLAELRQPYDRLLLKVLSLLQDTDPPLAKDIVASREAIWSVLANPVAFSTI